MTLKEKILDQYGTMRHFCRKNGVSYSSTNHVINNAAKSKPVVDAFISNGFIRSCFDLPQYDPNQIDLRFKDNK